jgi:Family of unknown function (DUF6221)
MQPARAQSRAEGLAEFLAARLDEDERNARDALALWPDTHFTVDPGSLVIVGFHRRHDPGRVLREVAAKRAILDRHVSAARTSSRSPACRECDDELRGAWPCPTIRHLASVYSGHPGYRQEWKP